MAPPTAMDLLGKRDVEIMSLLAVPRTRSIMVNTVILRKTGTDRAEVLLFYSESEQNHYRAITVRPIHQVKLATFLIERAAIQANIELVESDFMGALDIKILGDCDSTELTYIVVLGDGRCGFRVDKFFYPWGGWKSRAWVQEQTNEEMDPHIKRAIMESFDWASEHQDLIDARLLESR